MTDFSPIISPGVDSFPLRKPIAPAQIDSLSREIFILKKQLNAVILAHNYQVPEIQDVADYVGDSLGLSQQAAAKYNHIRLRCGRLLRKPKRIPNVIRNILDFRHLVIMREDDRIELFLEDKNLLCERLKMLSRHRLAHLQPFQLD